jgi:hypothetical protein
MNEATQMIEGVGHRHAQPGVGEADCLDRFLIIEDGISVRNEPIMMIGRVANRHGKGTKGIDVVLGQSRTDA